MSGIEDTLTSMDSKHNGLATQMTEMQATMEYNDRGEKALLLDSAWKTFEHDYMEDSLDKQMSEYNGKLINGAKAWCLNPSTRYSDGVDNNPLASFAALNAEMDKGNLPKDKENPKEDPEITAPDTYDGRGTLMATLMMLLASLMVWRMKKAKATAN